MYGNIRWWRLDGCDPPYSYAWAGCGTSPRHHRTMETRGHTGGAFGVRRPLRFLAWKLELDEEQLAEVAAILAGLKMEQAQAEVDRAKRLSAFADAVSASAFDAGRAAEGAALRVASAERMRGATTKALERLHALLDADQRRTLAYLIRTGSLTL